jgi:hypothetical protein
MTIKTLILILAAAGGLAGGAAAGESADRASGPARTAVVAQVPEACAPSPARATAAAAARAATATTEPGAPGAATATVEPGAPRAAAALRAAAPPGARVVLVCGATDAQAAVVRLTAEGYTDVLWSGPEPRAAAGLVAPDHPATRYGPLGG